jgi:hypothetical protein
LLTNGTYEITTVFLACFSILNFTNVCELYYQQSFDLTGFSVLKVICANNSFNRFNAINFFTSKRNFYYQQFLLFLTGLVEEFHVMDFLDTIRVSGGGPCKYRCQLCTLESLDRSNMRRYFFEAPTYVPH